MFLRIQDDDDDNSFMNDHLSPPLRGHTRDFFDDGFRQIDEMMRSIDNMFSNFHVRESFPQGTIIMSGSCLCVKQNGYI